PQAEEVLRYAERVLGQTADLARWARTVREGRAGPLRVGLIDVAAVEHHPAVLRAFRRSRPNVDLHLTVAPSGELLGRLGRGSLDVAVCVEPTQAGFTSVALLDEPLGVYAPEDVAVGSADGWGPWVSFPPGSQTRALVAAALRDRGAPFEVVAESHQPEVLCEMVRLGVGWTVLPVVQAEHGPAPLRRAVPDVLVHRRLAAVRRADGPPDPAVDALVEALLAHHRARPSGAP
ncbi:MAG: LysR family transcriptional regulator substrate-binding protein, partial [Acidimicrobiales bacterium]|nr:LysR family transcriptional regulator substrate-binding protein [Acidimicrobiales bacterium]